jgi:hypothetical protein
LEFVVVVRVKKLHPALKHGAYSARGVLPGENRAAFKKLQQGLKAELQPDGPLEEDIVNDIARWMWRKKNLDTFRLAEAARRHYSAIWETVPSTSPTLSFLELARTPGWTPPDPAQVKAATEAAEVRTR